MPRKSTFSRQLEANETLSDWQAALGIGGSVTAADVANVPAGNIAATDVQTALNELDTEKLAASTYTAADVLAKLVTVDGSGSGLDADLLDGNSSAAFQPVDADLTSWAGVTRASGFDTFTATPSSANLASLLTDDAFSLSDADLGEIAALSNVAGDILYTDNTPAWNRLPKGSDGQVLTLASGLPSWASSAGTSLAALDYRAITSGDTVGTGDRYSLVRATSGTFSLAFSAVATLGDKAWGYIENAGTGVVTLDPDSAELIDGVANWALYSGGAILWWVDSTNIKTLLLKPMVASFSASGNFIVPGCGTRARGRVGGAGGSGGRGGANDGGGGGGGGGSAPFDFLLSTVGVAGASVAVTIGAGGIAISADNTDGNPGGNSTFGALSTGYGGGGGSGNGTECGGGGGGGSISAGATATSATGGSGGQPTTTGGGQASGFGGGGGSAGTAATTATGGASGYGGGGGGGGNDAASGIGGTGGSSLWGGGGGGGGTSNATSTGGTGGTSRYGTGNGGNGADNANNGVAGTAGSNGGGGGGGGGVESGTSGAGGNGSALIEVY